MHCGNLYPLRGRYVCPKKRRGGEEAKDSTERGKSSGEYYAQLSKAQIAWSFPVEALAFCPPPCPRLSSRSRQELKCHDLLASRLSQGAGTQPQRVVTASIAHISHYSMKVGIWALLPSLAFQIDICYSMMKVSQRACSLASFITYNASPFRSHFSGLDLCPRPGSLSCATFNHYGGNASTSGHGPNPSSSRSASKRRDPQLCGSTLCGLESQSLCVYDSAANAIVSSSASSSLGSIAHARSR